jgi:hypothetical protein
VSANPGLPQAVVALKAMVKSFPVLLWISSIISTHRALTKRGNGVGRCP